MTQTLFPGAQILNGGSQVAVSPSQSANDTQIATMENIAAIPTPFSQFFESTQQTVTTTRQSVNHGLSSFPKIVTVSLKCTTAEAGYAVGDEINGFGNHAGSSGGVLYTNIYTSWDAASISFSLGSFGLLYVNDTTGAAVNLNAANWRVVLRAWA